MKRIIDVFAALIGLLLFSPVLVLFMILIWLQDFCSPFYVAPRVGKDGKTFNMIKLRSMITGADKSGVDSTGNTDRRITNLGKLIRRYKLDEIPQLWNVLTGDMSLVGPRPNVLREVALYTPVEKRLLSVKPGITDIASIVFSDEGEILSGMVDPDIAYHQLIRPGKGRLGLFYVENASLNLDVTLIYLTFVAILSREKALARLSILLSDLKAPDLIVEIALRKKPLEPMPPLGSNEVVTSR